MVFDILAKIGLCQEKSKDLMRIFFSDHLFLQGEQNLVFCTIFNNQLPLNNIYKLLM